MTVCHHCGQDMPLSDAQRGPLLLTNMGDVYWHGIKKGHLSPAQAKILATIMRRGEATNLSLTMLVASDSDNGLNTLMFKLRQTLANWCLPVSIRTVRGFGYRLEISE